MFDEAEKKGRRKFKRQFAEFNIEFQNQTCPYDALLTACGHTAIVEIKNRQYDSEAFDDWMLEKDKYKKLNRAVDNHPKANTALYVNFYTDDTYRLWDLSEYDDLESSTKWCPKTTVKSSKNIENHIFHLPPIRKYRLN